MDEFKRERHPVHAEFSGIDAHGTIMFTAFHEKVQGFESARFPTFHFHLPDVSCFRVKMNIAHGAWI